MRIVIMLLCCLALFACGGPDDGPSTSPAPPSGTGPRSAATPSASATATTATTATAKASPAPSGLDGREGFVAVIGAMDPRLAADREGALERASEICLDIQEGENRASVRRNARSRFTDGTVTVSAEQAAEIVAAAEEYVC